MNLYQLIAKLAAIAADGGGGKCVHVFDGYDWLELLSSMVSQDQGTGRCLIDLTHWQDGDAQA